MKFNEEILKQLNLEQAIEKEPVNIMKVNVALAFLKTCAERIILSLIISIFIIVK